MRKKYTNPAVFTLYGEPLLIVEGYMQWLFDETGKRYLDMFAGIVTVSCGHCHPKIVAAIEKQVETLQHATTIYLHPNFPLFAKKLASKMPKGLDVTYFVNDGSEANDLAITMARLHTGNTDVIALRNGYHGGSPSAMGLTSHNTWKYPVPGALGVHHAVCPDPYRSQFTGTPEEIASKSADDILGIIRYSTPGKIAAFIAEPIQGVGGATHGARNYLSEAYRITREHGGLCIADEVQTGFGRTGDHYWGFENFDVVPDFVTMAKGIGNGVPLGAVTTRMEIAQTDDAADSLQYLRRQSGLHGCGPRGSRRHRRGRLAGKLPRAGKEAQGRIPGAGEAPPIDWRRSRNGIDARRGAGSRQKHKAAGEAGNAGGSGSSSRNGCARRQGWSRWQRFADQAADVHHRRRRRLHD